MTPLTFSVKGVIVYSYNERQPMSNNSSSSSSGIGLPGLLTVLFVGLKLTGHITWSWWWVLSPMWITILIALAFFAFAFIILLLQQK
jgi:uncharacterized protein (DUF983 family)